MEPAKRSLLRGIGKPQAADAIRPANPLPSRPEVDSGTVEEPCRIEAAVQVDVRVQQDSLG